MEKGLGWMERYRPYRVPGWITSGVGAASTVGAVVLAYSYFALDARMQTAKTNYEAVFEADQIEEAYAEYNAAYQAKTKSLTWAIVTGSTGVVLLVAGAILGRIEEAEETASAATAKPAGAAPGAMLLVLPNRVVVCWRF
jgi:hypothetical protein